MFNLCFHGETCRTQPVGLRLLQPQTPSAVASGSRPKGFVDKPGKLHAVPWPWKKTCMSGLVIENWHVSYDETILQKCKGINWQGYCEIRSRSWGSKWRNNPMISFSPFAANKISDSQHVLGRSWKAVERHMSKMCDASRNCFGYGALLWPFGRVPSCAKIFWVHLAGGPKMVAFEVEHDKHQITKIKIILPTGYTGYDSGNILNQAAIYGHLWPSDQGLAWIVSWILEFDPKIQQLC